jgi:hypothetical protein
MPFSWILLGVGVQYRSRHGISNLKNVALLGKHIGYAVPLEQHVLLSDVNGTHTGYLKAYFQTRVATWALAKSARAAGQRDRTMAG